MDNQRINRLEEEVGSLHSGHERLFKEFHELFSAMNTHFDQISSNHVEQGESSHNPGFQGGGRGSGQIGSTCSYNFQGLLISSTSLNSMEVKVLLIGCARLTNPLHSIKHRRRIWCLCHLSIWKLKYSIGSRY